MPAPVARPIEQKVWSCPNNDALWNFLKPDIVLCMEAQTWWIRILKATGRTVSEATAREIGGIQMASMAYTRIHSSVNSYLSALCTHKTVDVHTSFGLSFVYWFVSAERSYSFCAVHPYVCQPSFLGRENIFLMSGFLWDGGFLLDSHGRSWDEDLLVLMPRVVFEMRIMFFGCPGLFFEMGIMFFGCPGLFLIWG